MNPSPAPAATPKTPGDKTNSPNARLGRRGFLGLAWGMALGLLFGQVLVVMGRFIRPNQEGEFGGLVRAGRVEEFEPGSVSHIQTARTYLYRLPEGSFLALWQRCPHLGCSVPWNQAEQRYRCPCHSSNFTITGEVTGGPAPRPLDYFPVILRDGEVYVETGSPTTRSQFDPSQTTPT